MLFRPEEGLLPGSKNACPGQVRGLRKLGQNSLFERRLPGSSWHFCKNVDQKPNKKVGVTPRETDQDRQKGLPDAQTFE